MTDHPSAETAETQVADDPPGEVKSVLPLPWAIWFWAQARKIVIAVIGTTVILAGLAMLILPGPGWVTIFAGLAILATEFAWAKWTLKHAKERVTRLAEKYVGIELVGGDSSKGRAGDGAGGDQARKE